MLSYNLSIVPGFNDLLKSNGESNSNILKLNKVEYKKLNVTNKT